MPFLSSPMFFVEGRPEVPFSNKTKFLPHHQTQVRKRPIVMDNESADGPIESGFGKRMRFDAAACLDPQRPDETSLSQPPAKWPRTDYICDNNNSVGFFGSPSDTMEEDNLPHKRPWRLVEHIEEVDSRPWRKSIEPESIAKVTLNDEIIKNNNQDEIMNRLNSQYLNADCHALVLYKPPQFKFKEALLSNYKNQEEQDSQRISEDYEMDVI